MIMSFPSYSSIKCGRLIGDHRGEGKKIPDKISSVSSVLFYVSFGVFLKKEDLLIG